MSERFGLQPWKAWASCTRLVVIVPNYLSQWARSAAALGAGTVRFAGVGSGTAAAAQRSLHVVRFARPRRSSSSQGPKAEV